MGKVAYQLLVGQRLLAHALLAVLAHLLLQRPQLHQNALLLFPPGEVGMHGEGILQAAPQLRLKAQR